ncbi:unnamed protein product [Strongylus vulgaris]|uniref:Peptidase C1A papain C-terminal domain-containing protein n=1 Tax=Strongylus vulgaris TaxID=40348 RepID=A0A3P7KDG6_STRVU|nr:unnamed protein product [Strongylus vulgaris]
MTNGPVQSAFDTYTDFRNYTGGIYEVGHAIKIIGWGKTENGTKYWTIANSWSVDWGEKDSVSKKRINYWQTSAAGRRATGNR